VRRLKKTTKKKRKKEEEKKDRITRCNNSNLGEEEKENADKKE